jgi:hypothetical protein
LATFQSAALASSVRASATISSGWARRVAAAAAAERRDAGEQGEETERHGGFFS